jgi:iron complex transport system permease protein
MKRMNPSRVLLSLVIILPLFIVCGILTGAVNIPLSDLFSVVSERISLDQTQAPHFYQAIIFDIRLPRVLLAVFVGAILAVSGAVMQGLFRNPLADPSIIGVTAGASLGASLVIVFFTGYQVPWLSMSVLSAGAFIGGIVAVYIVYSLAKNPFGTSVATMLLAGIGITALVGSLTGFLDFYANNEMLRRISLWRMGGLEAATFNHVLLAGFVVLLMGTVLPRYSYALNALLLGESEARHLGVDTEKLKKVTIVFVAAAVGICVALAGVIGFIGLVVPHIFRLLIGPDHRHLLPASALGGAILLVLSDNISRVVLAPVELPVGIITALIGVPFFISLLTRRHSLGVS